MINFYVPSEYEAMLLAAGWITLEDIDDQYIQYKQRAKYITHEYILNEHLMDYESWKNTENRLNALNWRYQNEVDPYYSKPVFISRSVPEHIQELGNQLIKEMSEIETILGY